MTYVELLDFVALLKVIFFTLQLGDGLVKLLGLIGQLALVETTDFKWLNSLLQDGFLLRLQLLLGLLRNSFFLQSTLQYA